MRKLLFTLLCLLCSLNVGAQNAAYQQYIEQYKDLAIEQMQLYGIPASITLAQGLLESGAGRSTLATKANNHFGIKTGGNWTGPYVLRDDDAPNERFRKYDCAEESFRDHSLFLRSRSRYASLFLLSPTDYKGWAHGLKAAGYATNPQYAQRLINLIETYNLAQYDTGGAKRHKSGHDTPKAKGQATTCTSHQLHLCNDIVYVIAQQGDSYKSIAKELGMREKKLRKYNEVDKHQPLDAGNRVYLTKKQKHVEKSLRKTYYTAKAGDSMHAIAQRYAIRLDRLYKWNHLPDDYRLKVGDRLLLK